MTIYVLKIHLNRIYWDLRIQFGQWWQLLVSQLSQSFHYLKFQIDGSSRYQHCNMIWISASNLTNDGSRWLCIKVSILPIVDINVATCFESVQCWSRIGFVFCVWIVTKYRTKPTYIVNISNKELVLTFVWGFFFERFTFKNLSTH